MSLKLNGRDRDGRIKARWSCEGLFSRFDMASSQWYSVVSILVIGFKAVDGLEENLSVGKGFFLFLITGHWYTVTW